MATIGATAMTKRKVRRRDSGMAGSPGLLPAGTWGPGGAETYASARSASIRQWSRRPMGLLGQSSTPDGPHRHRTPAVAWTNARQCRLRGAYSVAPAHQYERTGRPPSGRRRPSEWPVPSAAMHTQLCYTDAYVRATEGHVVQIAGEEAPLVVLDRTAFYPGGG